MEPTANARVVAVLTARTGSTRFPGKVLAPLGDNTLLEHVVRSAQESTRINAVVVATTEDPADDPVAAAAIEMGAGLFRGSSADVLGRLRNAAKAFGAQVVVRLTVDNPLVPPLIIDRVVERHLDTGADFTCNYLPPTFPDGTEVEAVSMPVLEHLHATTMAPRDREHVTWYIRTHPRDFHVENVLATRDYSHMRWSIDTPEDLSRVQRALDREIQSTVSEMVRRPDGGRAEVGLCLPCSEVFSRNSDRVSGIAEAVSHKRPTQPDFPGKTLFLESSLNLCDPDLPLKAADDLAALSSGRYASVACDIGPNCSDWKLVESSNGYPRYVSVSDPLSEERMLEAAVANADHIRSHFGGAIKAENLNYFPTGAYESVCEPEFVDEVVRGANVELLLDVGHAVISAHNLSLSVGEYLDRLPLDCVREVHLSRAGVVEGIWEDTHAIPASREFELLDFLAARLPLRYVTLEYYGDDDQFLRACELLQAWIGTDTHASGHLA